MTHRARKRFGQNFLHDPGVIRRIVAAVSPREGDRVVEIGPGQGAITEGLVEGASDFIALELDRDLAGPLANRFADRPGVRVIQADALKFDFSALAEEPRQLRLVGNLPYNISTPLLFHLLAQSKWIRDMHFMLQKEVVDRMAAAPGSKTYGRLSVAVQLQCRVESLFVIGPGAFRPSPKVDSAVVRLIPFETPPHPIEDPDLFARMLSQCFSMRRKTLRNGLKEWLTAEEILALGIDPSDRPERLPPEAFVALAAASCKKRRSA